MSFSKIMFRNEELHNILFFTEKMAEETVESYHDDNDENAHGYEYDEESTDAILIDTVKHYPYLYDKQQKDFKNTEKKDRTWMEIDNILNSK